MAAFKFFFRGAGIALRFDQRFDGAPVPTLEVLARLSHRVGLGLRADPETGALGGNLAVRLGRIRWQSSHLVHPVLGPTHRFHLGVGDPEGSVR